MNGKTTYGKCSRPMATGWRSQDVNLLPSHANRTLMDVLGMRDEMADLDALHPRMLDDIIDERPQLRVRLEHLADHRPTRPRGEVVDRRRTRRLRRGIACGDVRGEELVRRLRHCPRELLEVQAVIDNSAGPDIHQPSVIG